MSQQTPVARVIPSWKAWLERWPTPTALAAASPAEVILAWGNLGYPRRALRLLDCARELVAHWDGELPRTREDLLSLPGIGSYTASAILAFAYRRRTTVLDTNIRRVLARQQGLSHPRSSLTRAEERHAESLVPTDDEEATLWNAALMELGALICTARAPRCEECPVASSCQWRGLGWPEASHPKRTQTYTGTHREARGKIMAVLRSSSHALAIDELQRASTLPTLRFSPALESLLVDKLAVERDGRIALPASS